MPVLWREPLGRQRISFQVTGNPKLTQLLQYVGSRFANLFSSFLSQTVNMKFDQGTSSNLTATRMRLEVYARKQTLHPNKNRRERRLDNSINFQSCLDRSSPTTFLKQWNNRFSEDGLHFPWNTRQ